MRVPLCQTFKKKADPQGACNKMHKSLESTCLHHPESSGPWFPGQTQPSATLRRWLLLFVWPLAAAVTELHRAVCTTQSIPKQHQPCCQPWWGLWCSGSLPRSTEGSPQKASRVLLSYGSQGWWGCFPCGLEQCFSIDAGWGITQRTPSLHLTSVSSYSFSYYFFSFISKSDVDFLGVCCHWASRDVDQALNYSFHS